MSVIITHIVLGETGNVARQGLQPVQAVVRCEELQHAAADSVHGDYLESVFPKRIAEISG